ncbi:acyl-CoA dehydrogenase family protein [Pseudarthrobacter sp. AL07]|uniref:acyl-CoA dehydrogenase family protein n=1 Tax=unclassified Pseudarthrobacter TaxID=2647000 RepID=UPI00162A48D6|nr:MULTISPECIES: acyl-CoA dehydrogenase family protein [unclassified Pseudarthrobacter]MBE4716980.1 acyl-CoA dehydrogenase [Pseudarthrobacter sp. AB1]MDI3193340.1 acyl-CoA dehydrogenase family protein [Pseudarthrobacter sp. AL20]MDI3207408.1 acyl-CoA dehydrogenase family protein [Pseudarthrobacter sp. AL07]QNE14083.1 acyl-CoA dehydrogenase [Pseudarthrobacter sp. NBSH8]
MSKKSIDINNLPYADGDFFAFEQLLTAKEQDRLAEIRGFLAREVRPIAVDCWNRGEFPMELIPKLAEIDLVSPVRRQGYSNLFAGLVHAEATRADTSIATFMGVHDGLFTGSIEALASQEQQDAWLPDIYSLKKIGAFGLTEPLGGSDVAGGTRTTAQRDGDTWILNGDKRWIGNATFSDWVVIYARDLADNQVKGFLVDTALPGFSATKIENKISLRTVQNADIVLENVVVPDFFKLAGANSFRDTNKVLKVTRLSVGWQAVGQQLAAFDVARRYAVERHQFGRPLASFQLVQSQLVQILGNAVSSMGMMVRLSQLEDAGQAKDEQSALAKAFTTARMRESVAIGRSLLGGNGIVTDFEMAKIFADAEAIYSYEGTHEINTLVTGRAITGISAIV